MAKSARDFATRLCEALSSELGPEFKFSRSRLELARKTPNGLDIVALAVTGKYSPHLSVAFYFGKRFSEAARFEAALGGYKFPYHVQQYSMNRQPLYQASYTGPDHWSITLQHPIPSLAAEIAAAVRGMAFPFFGHFQHVNTARDAIAADSAECFGGPMYWRQLLLLDAVLGDLAHFLDWSVCLDEWTQSQAKEAVLSVQQVSSGAV